MEPQQEAALAKAGAWLRMRYSPSFYLAGYAGTGKTTLAKKLAEHVKGKVAFGAFTGKAASVMRAKGCADASTIHSLIYDVSPDTVSGQLLVTLKGSIGDIDLIVIDECSMVDADMGRDLLSFGVPILVLGDPAQLPPVKGAGFFTSKDPDALLTEVHRQAADSPILRLATEIREGRFKPRPTAEPGLTISERGSLDPDLVTGADIVIVGRNDTRQRYTKRLREMFGRETRFPAKGEPVICLRNDRSLGVFNGEICEVLSSQLREKHLSMKIQSPARTIDAKVHPEFFLDDVEAARMPFRELEGTQQFTYGYAITCHKSQGSQWEKVCVFNESGAFREDAQRWLYTAVTRASEHLTLVV